MSLLTFITGPFVPVVNKKEQRARQKREDLEAAVQELPKLIEECQTDPLAVYRRTHCCGMEKIDTLVEWQVQEVKQQQAKYRRDLESAQRALSTIRS